MKPFYFGESARPLFGLHHPPAGRVRRRTGVVLCHPFGQEYVRAHRAMRELASAVSDAGFHALRFDYFGTGDSGGGGHEVDFASWDQDLDLAVEETKESASSSSVALVGLRLGAAAAAAFARGRRDVAALLLWDPVVDGAAYLRELEDAQRAWLLDHPAVKASPKIDEVLGFPVSERMRTSLAAMNLQTSPPTTPKVLIVRTGGLGTPSLWPEPPPDIRVERREIPGAPVWRKADDISVSQVLVPRPVIESITSWLGEACA